MHHVDAPGALPAPGRTPALWVFLVGLIAIAVAPMALASGLWLAAHAASERQKLEQALSLQAQALSLAIEREIAGIGDVLDALGRSPALEARDWPAFHAHASRIAESRQSNFVSLFNPEGQQVINTARPFGSPLPTPFKQPAPEAQPTAPPRGDASSLRRVLAAQTRSNSNLFRALINDKLIFTVDVPVFQAGALTHVLNIGLEPQAIDFVLRSVASSELTYLVVDARNVVVARSNVDGSPVGTQAGPRYVRARSTSANFVAEGLTPAGVATIFAAHTSPLTGWTTVVVAPQARVEETVRASWLAAALGLGGTLLLGCAMAATLARRIVVTVTQVGGPVEGGPPVPLALRAREFLNLQAQRLRAAQIERDAARDRRAAEEAEVRHHAAEEAGRAKDLFIATLAHELRTPLQVIGLSAAQLQRKPEQAVEVARRIDRQCTVVARLLEDVTDATAVARGKVHLRLERVDVVAAVEEFVAEFRQRPEAAGRAVSLEVPEEPLAVEADVVRLRQIVRNLLDNAARYSPEGSPIEVTVRASEAVVDVFVRDAGRGLFEKDLERVFEPFEQLATGAGYRGGLGLGLPLSRNLARLHGGELELHSEGPGKGCTSRLRLPRAGARP